MDSHPVQLVVTDDLRRSRLTVFFRPLLAIPHLVALFFWTVVVIPAAFLTWLSTLVAGRPPRPLHEFLSHYVVYVTRFSAYLWLAADPWPEFSGKPQFPYPYPIDLRMPEAARRSATARSSGRTC